MEARGSDDDDDDNFNNNDNDDLRSSDGVPVRVASVPESPWNHSKLHRHQVDLIRCFSRDSDSLKIIREHCNLWRNNYDVQDNWASVSSIIDFYGDNKDGFLEV